jgi:hypothetical protein
MDHVIETHNIHARHIYQHQKDKLALAEHSIKAGHCINFKDTRETLDSLKLINEWAVNIHERSVAIRKHGRKNQ